MQLITIGEAKPKTVLDMVQEMANRQFAEMQILKAAAQERLQKLPPLARAM
jgi:hypothetical protein